MKDITDDSPIGEVGLGWCVHQPTIDGGKQIVVVVTPQDGDGYVHSLCLRCAKDAVTRLEKSLGAEPKQSVLP